MCAARFFISQQLPRSNDLPLLALYSIPYTHKSAFIEATVCYVIRQLLVTSNNVVQQNVKWRSEQDIADFMYMGKTSSHYSHI